MEDRWKNWVWIVFLVWYGVGLVLVSLDWLPPALQWANAVFLYLSGFLAVLYAGMVFKRGMGYWLSAIIIIGTIAAESLGVHYGWIFGSYHYEKDFGIQLFGVPVTIGFAWVMVIFTSMAYFEWMLNGKKTVKNALLYSIATSILAVTMDLIIDPVAYKGRQYWIWEGDGIYYDIPTQNFLGWFYVSFVIQFILYYLLRDTSFPKGWSRRMRWLYGMVVGMFVVTSMVEGLWLAVFVTLTVYGIMLIIRKIWRESYDRA
ncbi:carotenoid biosynthesis protein [Rossellomorea marisflavi]|uniref:carotenoid biosynthesis protein n=1 Tax=Rossellomorea marisflavi TaxID=189381 RepID=UPI0020796D9F|nr:carotenoid biosynthesis protein [Rossellomorea marisflavi]USK90486.1 carotenoid biosynthesis protein [Rossellomorea marisflavi]